MASTAPSIPDPLPRSRLDVPEGAPITIGRYYAMHMMGALFPLTAGLLLYGWRAALVVLAVLASAILGTLAWSRVGARGAMLRMSHVMWMALVLGLMLPPHLLLPQGSADGAAPHLWAAVPAAGLALAALAWVMGGIGSSRIHPVLVAYLLLALALDLGHRPGQTLQPQRILQRNHLFAGDLADAEQPHESYFTADGWVRAPLVGGRDAVQLSQTAAMALGEYTSAKQTPERAFASLDSLMRERMPPLEDLILGGHPGPIGASSAIAVIVGGLFLLYRGLIDFRIPLLLVGSAIVAMLLLPVPLIITENGPQWRPLLLGGRGIDWATALTFANYEVMAGPLLLAAFYLATAPSVRPMSRRGRAVFALFVGVLAAAGQLYVSVYYGAYIALLLAGLVSPYIDRWFAARPLV